jgi:hypothetical protein
LNFECQYQLTGYREWLEVQPNGHRTPGILPSGFAITLNSITISTARGILFERLRGSKLQEIILPIINPSNFQTLN